MELGTSFDVSQRTTSIAFLEVVVLEIIDIGGTCCTVGRKDRGGGFGRAEMNLVDGGRGRLGGRLEHLTVSKGVDERRLARAELAHEGDDELRAILSGALSQLGGLGHIGLDA